MLICSSPRNRSKIRSDQQYYHGVALSKLTGGFTHYLMIPNVLSLRCITVSPSAHRGRHRVDKTINTALDSREMERRYKVFANNNKRNVDEYNADPSEGHMPYLVVVIDELADLMAQAANEAEATIVRLAQMARATGIHLIVATQRPPVDVITGLIKANIPTRIAFAVASSIDPRTILDGMGAEDLLGRGDMLYLPTGMNKPVRIQGIYISTAEMERVTNMVKLTVEPNMMKVLLRLAAGNF